VLSERATIGVVKTRSALDAALARVGDRWSLLIVEALLEGPRRFNDLSDALPGIAPNVLTDRLRRLEREGVVVAQPYSERPARLAYSLTEDGSELAGVLRLLAAWGASGSDAGSDARSEGSESEALRHLACGTALEARWYCPTCALTVGDDEESSLRYA
jgi:DNA-binding HxlR family transcriptional regulator